jgi:pilus assembly protein CpaB
MDVKKVALLVGALVIAVVTAIMAKNMFTGAGAEQANAAPVVPAGPKVLVARKALPVGTIIDAESLAFQAWPKELVQNAYYTEGAPDSDITKLLGTVVRNEVTAGQPLTRGSIVAPGDRGFLAAALGPGMRAVTVPTDGETGGVGGFLFPGDRVDLVLTQDVVGGGDGPPLKVSETIVRNLRVLAIDQKVDVKTEDGKKEIVKAQTVTLEATQRIAEKIAVSRTMGKLSLSLRSIADNTAELERAVASGEVKVPAGTNPADEHRMLLAIANRPADNNTTYVTGGDVSRFQRSSVPSKASSGTEQAGNAMSQFATAMGRAISGKEPVGPDGSQASGPGVRVARGNTVTVVPVGAR